MGHLLYEQAGAKAIAQPLPTRSSLPSGSVTKSTSQGILLFSAGCFIATSRS